MSHLPPPLPLGNTAQSIVSGAPPVLPVSSEQRAPLPDPETFEEQPILRRRRGDAEMDMTPMVDVVFLLLIFFMVTAAFGMQKSIEMPSPESDQSSRETKVEEREQTDEEIVVHVTAENKIYVEGDEATTPQELYARLREQQHRNADRKARHLLILAEPEAMHDLVVQVLDAGAGVGMETIRLKTE